MLPPLLERFRQEIRTQLPPNARVVVAVSGGIDSVALLHLLVTSQWPPAGQLLVAHFNHGLRPESNQEEQFTRTLASQWDLPFVTATWSPQTCSSSLQESARQARYHFLIQAAHAFQASHVATGHHLNDQIETLLDRLLRGSGVCGLTAMRPTRPLTDDLQLIRPLLQVRRSELHDWLLTHQLLWREDPTNAQNRYRRNRIRHSVLPALQEALQNDPISPIRQSLQHLAEADEALEWTLNQQWPHLDLQISHQPRALSLAHAPLRALPAELIRRVLTRCHSLTTRLPHPPGEAATRQLLHLLRSGRHHWEMVLRGMRIVRKEDRLYCLPFAGPARCHPWNRSAWGAWETVEFLHSPPYDGE